MTSPSIPLPAETISHENASPAPASTWRVALDGFARGALYAAILVSALLGLEYDFGFPRVIGAAVMGFLGFALVSAGEGLAILLWRLLSFVFSRLHWQRTLDRLTAVPAASVGRIAGAFIFIAGDILWPESFFQHITLPVAGEIFIVLASLIVMTVAVARMPGRTPLQQVALVGVPVLLLVAFAYWVIDPGFDDYLTPGPAAAAVTSTSLDNPGLPGPYTVKTLNYGSGQDIRRPIYGESTDLVTPVVDATSIYPGYSGLVASYFNWYWGFDFSRLPLNAMVWYPEGEGPFPLVLIVHGNHAMSDYSEPGYAYLGEHLASQGYITASVDQNFLNGLAFFDGEFEEMPVRAWLLLQHLQQWRTWNETPGHPFYGQVDLDRVALMGHSRGGEAAVWAEHLNSQAMEPVASVSSPNDFDFGIRGVVSIAPSDAYGGPGGRKARLDRANYLLLAGGHDGDTSILYGQQQYNRSRLRDNPGGFKALAYLYRANHGQFNSVWGDQDRGLFNSLLLNREPLLTGAEQEQAAKVLITSFLNAAVRDETEYRTVFNNPGTAASWLPAGVLVTQYRDHPFVRIDTNEGVSSVEATDITGATASALGTTQAKVEALKLRDGETNQGNKALRLAWDAGSEPTYVISLATDVASDLDVSPDGALAFSLASVPGVSQGARMVVELEAADGTVSQVAIEDLPDKAPLLPAYPVKANWLLGMNGFPGDQSAEEIVMQSFSIPVSAFHAGNEPFRIDQLSAIRFLFDGSEAGSIYIDDVGFSS